MGTREMYYARHVVDHGAETIARDPMNGMRSSFSPTTSRPEMTVTLDTCRRRPTERFVEAVVGSAELRVVHAAVLTREAGWRNQHTIRA
jgi:hypothetical protein